jgi:hypothetical protein
LQHPRRKSDFSSARHALILHSRATDAYTIRPLPGNTGTQIEADMVTPGQDCRHR